MDKLTSLNFLNFILKDQGDCSTQGNKSKWITSLCYAFFSQQKVDNIIFSIKILTKENTMTASIKTDLD